MDDTNLYEGMKNLATGYFDTVAQYNQDTKKEHHFSFQTVKDLAWGDAVGKILGKENAIGDIQEGMKSMFTAAAKAGAIATVGMIAGGETLGVEALGKAALGAFTDLVVEGSTRAFGQEEEERIILPAVEAAREAGADLIGPLPPDTAFLEDRRAETDAYICMYHDQGHIIMKALAFDRAVNTTLGLPFPRTSVDHGTALDIAWQGLAKPGSLYAATRLAVHLAGKPVAP